MLIDGNDEEAMDDPVNEDAKIEFSEAVRILLALGVDQRRVAQRYWKECHGKSDCNRRRAERAVAAAEQLSATLGVRCRCVTRGMWQPSSFAVRKQLWQQWQGF